jgi:S1 RNA binding domain/Zc3h12a-like Ribonuclease NYN domain
MTKTPSRANNDLVVVDGSNIATEGRSMPSLAQLNEAVLSFREEFPNVNVTVVVDATFGHRIAKNEVAEFDEAVAHNELVAPPAGAVGRGDAFVLSIANKSGARILSNDSFQEFHGTYPWLFDEGRLVGGKPVPHVGWVFVSRVPVKGVVSRRSRADAAERAPSRRSASKLASQPMPVPVAPPPGSARTHKPKPKVAAKVSDVAALAPASAERSASPRGGPVNELLPFLDFIQHHPIGSSVSGVVESYSSHGAYVTIGDVRGYVPLRLMGSPPPRSAREVMKQGEAVTLVVDSFAPARRNIDLSLPGLGAHPAAAPEAPVAESTRKRGAKIAAASATSAAEAPAKQAAVTKRAPARRKAAGTKTEAPAKKTAAPAKKASAPAKKPAVAKTSAAAPSKKAATKKAPAKKRSVKDSSPQPLTAAPAPTAAKRARSGQTRKRASTTP